MLELYFDISKQHQHIDQFMLEELKLLYLEELQKMILDSIAVLIDGMNSSSFRDEALDYLTANRLATDESSVDLLSKDIFTQFKKDYASLIEINLEDRCLYVSETIMDFEYGTAYKPALSLITKSVQEAIRNLDGHAKL